MWFALPLVALLGVFVRRTRADGKFEIQLVSVLNPSSNLADGSCCGGGPPEPTTGSCPRQCRTAVHVCLKEFQPTPRPYGRCTFGQHWATNLGPSSLVTNNTLFVVPFNFSWNVSTTSYILYTYTRTHICVCYIYSLFLSSFL